ncbi:MAG: hypothetical protein KatS3mg068_0001 [Candidatus Sericytochromatia bacterium]|nr:MAG: hypothetical protein KatS3mg068_0001 [Candidatus Sericytochromatia bacterium]
MKGKIIISLFITLIISNNSYATSSFKDIDEGNKNYNSVNLIVNKYKVMSGFPDGTFKGEENITRYTYSTIMLNTIEILNKKMNEIEEKNIYDTNQSVLNDIKISNIPDFNKEHWAYESATTLLKIGLIKTFSDNTFRGEQKVDCLGFSIGLGRIMNIIYNSAPPVLKRKWEKENKKITSINGIAKDSPIFEPLKMAIENNLTDNKDLKEMMKPITRYEVAEYLIRLIDKLEEVRKYIVFTKI